MDNNENAVAPGPYGLLHLGRGSIGEAVRAMKDGKIVQRAGWNGKGLFVFMQIPSVISLDIVPNMQSLPEAVKKVFISRQADENKAIEATSHLLEGPAATIHQNINYSNQMAIVDGKNNINGWVPSASDALADDWLIIH